MPKPKPGTVAPSGPPINPFPQPPAEPCAPAPPKIYEVTDEAVKDYQKRKGSA